MIVHTPDHALMIPADARAVGITTARTTSQRRDPRTTDHTSHAVISYNPSIGIDRDHASIFVKPYQARTTTTRRTVSAATKRANVDTALMAGMGSIHTNDN